MDSINNALYSASHAIWGETHPEHIKQQQREQHGDEPLSGVQGKGIADDPYDGGNRDIQPGIPAEPEVISTPIGHDAPELSTAVNSENYESQLGGDEAAAAAAATGATTGPTGWDASRIPTGPEDPPFGTDPVSADATALSSTFNLSGGGGGGGLSRDLGPSIGAVNQTSVNPASIGAGTAGMDEYGDFENAPSDKCVRGLDLGGGGSSNGEASDRGEDNPAEEENPVEEPTAGGVDGVGGEGEGKGEGKGEGDGGGDDEVYAQVPHIKSNGPSKEALRGPSAPPAREEYEFERNMSQIKPAHTKPKAHKAGKAAKPATEDHHQKANVMSKMKERFGHLHHTNKT